MLLSRGKQDAFGKRGVFGAVCHQRPMYTPHTQRTNEAMLIGAVHGYRGLIRSLLQELKAELRAARLPVVATGGYAQLMASKLPEITSVQPLLTLEGLRLVWHAHHPSSRM